MSLSSLHNQSLSALRDSMAKGDFSPQELIDHYQARIKQHNPVLNAVISLADHRGNPASSPTKINLETQEKQSLANIPLIHKDVFCTQGLRTTAGSKMLENFVPPYSAHIVSCLDTAGAITIGKANMDEFAMGSNNENSAFGPCKNPWDVRRTPGGSSGGSAVSVAAGFAPFATGSDTGGSIRTPASHCGVTGIKPSYGMASRYGLIAYASSLDQAGVFARRAEDCALVLDAICTPDPRDSTMVPPALRPKESLMSGINTSIKGKKMGVCADLLSRCAPEQQSLLRSAIAQLERLGAVPVEINFPELNSALAAYYIIATAEASSNLARFDGVRYGHRTAKPANLSELYAKSRAEGFGEEVQRRILLGTFVLSHGYYDAYYLSALKVRRLVANQFHAIFSQCDFLALPVSTSPAPLLGARHSPMDEYWMDVFTVPINLAGLPALSMPVGQTLEGLPVGLQLTAPYFGERLMLAVAHQYQLETAHHLAFPHIFA